MANGLVRTEVGNFKMYNIIRRKNLLGNFFSCLASLFSWGLIIGIMLLCLATQCGIYSDGIVVLQLLLGVNMAGMNQGIHVLMICVTLIILPTLMGVLAKRRAKHA